MGTRPHRRGIAAAGLVLAAGLLVAGCTQSTGGAPGTDPLPGVSSDTVDVGFSIVDIGEVRKLIGFQQASYGDYDNLRKTIEVLIADVNAKGGMGGRQVRAVFNRYAGIDDSPEQSQAQCRGFTQDHSVMAAVLDGGYQNNTVPCFAEANTLLLYQSLIAQDQKSFEKHSPYLWSPSNPEYGSFMNAQLTSMKDAGFFDDASGVLLMASDDEVSRRTTADIVLPFLAQAGVSNVQVSYIDSTNTGSLGRTIKEALATGVARKLDRVIPVGGARIEPVALSDVGAKGYESQWAVSTYDNPYFSAFNENSIQGELRVGMTGAGYAPAQDVAEDQGPPFPDPANTAQNACMETITAGGAAPPENLRANWKMAFYYCDAVNFLKATLDHLPGADEITGLEFKEAVAKIGSDYESSLTLGSAWGPNVYAGTNTVMPLVWDEPCKCFTYTGEPITLGASPQSAPSSSGGEEAWPDAP
jgi:hypothetical protein